MAFKVLALLFVCLVVVSVEAAYLEQSRQEGEWWGGEASAKIAKEPCETKFCECREQGHECCSHNFMIDYDNAGEDVEKQHCAITKMGSCYHDVNPLERCPKDMHGDADHTDHDHDGHDDEGHEHTDDDHEHDDDDHDDDHEHDDDDHDHDDDPDDNTQ